ncbi:hypothetical protein MCOR02_011461 [Pyricularia oryzae]|nr:hypothetical protein MCOR02_011461 [Pyricularia oryzae]KAI6256017.1 hypothetical protein MCOR19_007502 [Pyricularia oryzae]KAI6624208.1 hypothetical protein MCOR07_003524 [Pyricularia oryzae]KAI6638072.1 hypothetical protein MCOR08_002792 [Pyricularia oryzae]
MILAYSLFTLQYARVAAQATIQGVMWNMPNGRAPSFSQTFTTGQTIPISWNPYNGTMVDLWLTPFDPDIGVEFSLLIKQGIDLSKRSPDHLWTIEGIPLDVLRRTPKEDPELSSKGFLIVQEAEKGIKASTTEMTTESRATDTVVSSATTSQLTPTPTNPPPPEHTDGQPAIINSENQAGLGMGSIVGIAVGSLAALALSVGLTVWCLCFRRRGTGRKT